MPAGSSVLDSGPVPSPTSQSSAGTAHPSLFEQSVLGKLLMAQVSPFGLAMAAIRQRAGS